MNRVTVLLFFLLPVVGACTVSQPKLKNRMLPETYYLDSIEWDNSDFDPQSLRYILLNDNSSAIDDIVDFWRRGLFHEVFKSVHPVVDVDRTSIMNMRLMLEEVLDIYYVSLFSPQSQDPAVEIQSQLESELKCQPLSNNELMFLLNSDIEAVFQQKTLTMLMISSIEALLQKNAKPIYPKVYSGFLRKQFNLPELEPIDRMNLFASKIRTGDAHNRTEGFVFCRKQK